MHQENHFVFVLFMYVFNFSDYFSSLDIDSFADSTNEETEDKDWTSAACQCFLYVSSQERML